MTHNNYQYLIHPIKYQAIVSIKKKKVSIVSANES